MILHKLPNSWTWSTLAEVALTNKNAIVDGPFGSNLKTSDYIPKGVPVLQGKNITNSHFEWKEIRYISEEKADDLKRSQVHIGDLLMVKIGSIGYSAYLEDLNGHDFAVIPANMAKISFDTKKVNKRYAWHWLNNPLSLRELNSLSSKTAQPALSLTKIKTFPIPLPPLSEQKRIAAILDKADDIRRKRRQAIKLADEFLRSVFLDMFGDPVINPMGYNDPPLGDLVDIISGGTPSRARKRFWSGMFLWVSPKDMKYITISNSIEKISEDVFSETSLKRIPKKSILIVIRGMILAHTIPIAITAKEVAINQDIKALKTCDSVLPEFLLWSLLVQHNFILSKVSTAAHGTKRIETADLQQIKIPLPSIVQQNRFIEIVYKFSKIEEQSAFSLKEAENLFYSLVQKAFRGEL